MKRKIFFMFIAYVVATLTPSAFAADWPMWRYDSSRTACSPEKLPDALSHQWTRQYTPREPVWDDPLNQDLMHYDDLFEPVVMNGVMYLGFNDTDKVVALDVATGNELWRRYLGGPARMPPVADGGRVYVTSDDSRLYCLDGATGKTVWTFTGAPSDRRVLGNERLISAWPARGGAVIADGFVYYAASIWPFMGTFIYCLDARTGKVVWRNEGEGSRYMLQPHNAPSFAGVAPQGAFVVSGDRLIIPGGRSVPAVFDRATGEFEYYRLAESGKVGGSFVCADGGVFFNHTRERSVTVYDISTGDILVQDIGKYPVIGADAWYFSGDRIAALGSEWLKVFSSARAGLKSNKMASLADSLVTRNRRWELAVDATGDLIMAGGRLYAAGGSTIACIDPGAGPQPRVVWTKHVSGRVGRLLAAGGRLFAVTTDGSIMAFGAEKPDEPRFLPAFSAASDPSLDAGRRVRELIDRTGVVDGYAMMYDSTDTDYLEALVTNTRLHVIAVVPGADEADRMRRRFDDAGMYGSRIEVHTGDPATFSVPSYLSSLTIVEGVSKIDTTLVRHLFTSMRPYGGVLELRGAGIDERALDELARKAGCEGARTRTAGGVVQLMREGPLPGSGVWTHNYGNIANTAKSDDRLVQLPLGLLWFGGSSNLDVLPRHGHGPAEQVIGGRLFIEGLECLSARDVYTGRVIWKKSLLDLGNYGVYYDASYRDAPTDTRYNQVHLAGANLRGTNFVATLDRVYILQGSDCVVLDSATGETTATFRLPPVDPKAEKKTYPEWGYIGVSGDYLIGGCGFVSFSELVSATKNDYSTWDDFDVSASKGLVVMNRTTGNVVWRADAEQGFLHNGIVAGNGRLYMLDRVPPAIEDQLSRRGKKSGKTNRIAVFDIASGKPLWELRKDVFGSYLSFSTARDMLVQSARPSRDMAPGESGTRMSMLRGADGSVVWDKKNKYETFPIIHGDTIITEGAFFSLVTGEKLTRIDPMTGAAEDWTWKRFYGCNYPIASENLITFRSGAAGFFDYASDGGTGNFGGFKSGCTVNLIAADGVLNAPDYTRTCSCPYQNQTSLAFVHMPDAGIEYWTFNPYKWNGKQVMHTGINIGAPGDRVDEDGVLWLDSPAIGGESPDLPIEYVPAKPALLRVHMARIAGEYPWVASSAAEGVEEIRVTLSKAPIQNGRYTVKLVFAELADAGKGERRFDVYLQGKRVARDVDIVGQTGSQYASLVKKFSGVRAGTTLTVSLKPVAGSKRPPIVSGVAIVKEK